MTNAKISPFVAIARSIGAEVAAVHATAVDRDARFPSESIAALKEHKMLSAYVPKSLGGGGASLGEMVLACEALSQHCTSTAMIFAMHQIQVISIMRHAGDSSWFIDYIRDLVVNQNLIASVTSEVGVGGEMRSSVCGLEWEGQMFKLIKHATTISYGAQADDLLVTSRCTPDGPASDQVLSLVRKADYTLEQQGVWDTMGMRGTCSPPFKLTATGKKDQVISAPFAAIASETMVPVSHLLWAGCWLGVAGAAVNKARAFVRMQARARPGSTPPTALRLAEVASELHMLRASVDSALREYEQLTAAEDGSADELSSMPYALKINNLKVAASRKLPEIVGQALLICGIMGYKNDSKFSMSRHLRDAHSGALMVGNDRILATNSSMLLVLKDE